MAAQVLKPQVYEPSVKLEYNDPEPVEFPLALSFADSQLRLAAQTR